MSSDYVGVHEPGNLVYVLIEDRAKFDLIALPKTDHREHGGKAVLSKNMDHGGVRLVFQHWIKLDADTAREGRERLGQAFATLDNPQDAGTKQASDAQRTEET